MCAWRCTLGRDVEVLRLRVAKLTAMAAEACTVLRMWEAGRTQEDIAAALGVTTRTVRRRFRLLGVPLRDVRGQRG